MMSIEERHLCRHPAGDIHVTVFSHGSLTMGIVIDLSLHGLRLEYQAVGEEPGKWEKVDLFSRHNNLLYLLGVPCRLNYDWAVSAGSRRAAGHIHTRVAGLEFGPLSHHQERVLRMLLGQRGT